MKRLVLVGGGHAHVEVLRRFGLQRERDVDVTLINTSRHTVYAGMLPGLVAGHYGWRACFIDLEVLSRFAGARLLRDIAIGLDLDRKLVRCADAASHVPPISTSSGRALPPHHSSRRYRVHPTSAPSLSRRCTNGTTSSQR